jgi:hypothetical protein
MKTKIDPLNVLLIAFISVFFIFWLLSCNPVKQVLRDQEKLEEVAKVVIKGGWCANDTTFIATSDTLIEVDTLVRFEPEIHTVIANDTVYITFYKTRDILKSTTIHDTIKSFIVDNARVRLLVADSARLSTEVDVWRGKAKQRQIWLFAIVAIICGALYIKSKI